VIVSGDAETVLHDRNAMREYFGERFDGDSIIEGKGAFGTAAETLRASRLQAGRSASESNANAQRNEPGGMSRAA
jgi:hypothetical protein